MEAITLRHTLLHLTFGMQSTPGYCRVSKEHDSHFRCKSCRQVPLGVDANLLKEGLQVNGGEEEEQQPDDGEESSTSDDDANLQGANSIYDPACCDCDDGGMPHILTLCCNHTMVQLVFYKW